MEDGVYESDSPLDKELLALQYDKYYLTASVTDAHSTGEAAGARSLR